MISIHRQTVSEDRVEAKQSQCHVINSYPKSNTENAEGKGIQSLLNKHCSICLVPSDGAFVFMITLEMIQLNPNHYSLKPF